MAGGSTGPLTFAPAGEPVLPRAVEVCTKPWERQRTSSGVPPRKRQVERNRLWAFRLRQVLGLVDVLRGLVSVASRADIAQCL